MAVGNLSVYDEKVIKTDFFYDPLELVKQYKKLTDSLPSTAWYQNTQTCLQHSPDCLLQSTEGCGSISRANGRTEQDFSLLNSTYKNTIFEQVIADVGAVRSRFLVKPKHTCYSIHSDRTGRFHLPITTHKHALFVFYEGETSSTIHIPADGYVYWTNTTKPHTFLNAGPNRVHMVMCEGKPQS